MRGIKAGLAALGIPTAMAVGIGLAIPAHADAYGLTPDYGCTVTWNSAYGPMISKPSCITAFLYEVHIENLVSIGGDQQLVYDGEVGCRYPARTALDTVAAQVRSADPTLSGGRPVFGGVEDVPASRLAWIAAGILCPV
jgi:hypothetical protein